MNSPSISFSEWSHAILSELQEAMVDHPPGNGWFTGPEIAAMLGLSKTNVHRLIPKAWPSKKFHRLNRAGAQMPTLHYKVPKDRLPAPVRTARSGKEKLKP